MSARKLLYGCLLQGSALVLTDKGLQDRPGGLPVFNREIQPEGRGSRLFYLVPQTEKGKGTGIINGVITEPALVHDRKFLPQPVPQPEELRLLRTLQEIMFNINKD